MSQPYISDQQLHTAGITRKIADNASEAWSFEHSTWANSATDTDLFYTVPPSSSLAASGTLLKVEEVTDTSKYTIPPSNALSRILYQTCTMNGSTVPAAASILWPYTPKLREDGKLPFVVWAHGTSGLFSNQAPSHLKGLSAQFSAPYTLALQGYVVVAPDYAGLGVSRTADGNTIKHEFLANPSHANDLYYSAQAAQMAFPRLTKEFVVFGHSQGGGAAWAAAQRQAVKPVEGYLGAIAASPVTDLLKLPSDGPLLEILIAYTLYTVKMLYPEFNYNDILTAEAAKRWALYLDLKGGVGVAFALLLGIPLLKPGWRQNAHLQDFIKRTSNGGKETSGPMLVLQGQSDMNISPDTTTQAVDATRLAHPDSQIQYHTWEGITHIPVLYASQQVWLGWIADRFAGKPVAAGCSKTLHTPILPAERYQSDPNWITKETTQLFELTMP